MIEIEHEDNKLRRKRPERQFYVPPAQRRSSINETNNVKNRPKHKNNLPNKKEKVITTKSNYEDKLITNNNNLDPQDKSDHHQIPNDTSNENKSFFDFFLCSYFIQLRWRCLISGSQLKFEKGCDFRHFQNEHFLLQIPLVLFSSYNNSSYLQQEKFGNYPNKYFYINNAFPFYNMKTELHCTNLNQNFRQIPIIVPDTHKNPYYSNVLKQFHMFCDYDMYNIDNILFIDNSYKYFPYFNLILEGYLLEKQNTCIFDITDNISNTSNMTNHLSNKDNASASDSIPRKPVQDQLNNKIEPLKNTLEKSLRKKRIQGKTDHEEELEIMKKTKEHINRKTRPIMKYVGESNDTLTIEHDSPKSWEDLFDEEGEIKEDLLNVDIKIQNSTPNPNSNSESCDYFKEDLKHVEELEHMVELYDFPPSFKTQDLIQAFSDINCEAMYIKWVDDTRAILVLGTLTQALKAANTNNPLIKVRPMAAASRTTLAIATKNDLKPAMKRPATNLQAARRFITAALGTNIGVSRERMAKEREDLKAAREMKKLMRKNERDAWEGNLQSSLQ